MENKNKNKKTSTKLFEKNNLFQTLVVALITFIASICGAIVTGSFMVKAQKVDIDKIRTEKYMEYSVKERNRLLETAVDYLYNIFSYKYIIEHKSLYQDDQKVGELAETLSRQTLELVQ